MKKFAAFVYKEFIHISRDPRTLLIMFLMPVVLVLLFGFAITNDIKNARTAVLDFSKDTLSAGLIERIGASEYFEIYASANSMEDADAMLRRGDVKAVLVIPEMFAERAAHDGSAQLKIILNASDPNEASNLAFYMENIAALESAEKFGLKASGISVTPVMNMLYNPQLKSAYQFVPGVMGLILFLICTLMTSVGIVGEKQNGNMEVLLVSPIKPIYIIISKAVPYFILSLLIVGVVLVISRFVLDVPIRGSIVLLFCVSGVYTLLAISLGIFVSTVSNTQQTAMFISAIFLMLPIMLLSGMIFPIENMPKILQVLSNFVPATWYIDAVKDIMLKGSGIKLVGDDILILLGMTFSCTVLSLLNFKTRLE